jgi:hypothetical protein
VPISPLREELVDGIPRQVQWFERNRIEIHPERPAPYTISMGRVGVERLEQQGRSWWTFPKEPGQPGQPCRTFPDTGHTICGDILATWQGNGLELDGQTGVNEAESLALFGMPISPPQVEMLPSGESRTVQWFERARLEVHPEMSPPFNVQIGLLGREMQDAEAGLIE